MKVLFHFKRKEEIKLKEDQTYKGKIFIYLG